VIKVNSVKVKAYNSKKRDEKGFELNQEKHRIGFHHWTL